MRDDGQDSSARRSRRTAVRLGTVDDPGSAPPACLIRSWAAHEANRHLADPVPHIAAGPDRFLACVLVSLLSLALMWSQPRSALPISCAREDRSWPSPGRPSAWSGSSPRPSSTASTSCNIRRSTPQPTEQMVELLERLEDEVGLRITFVGFIVGLLLGWVILSARLVMAGDVPRAIPILVLASMGPSLVGLEMLSRILFLIGLGWSGAP